MMGRLFWPVTALFLGAAFHLAYVLFAPSILFHRQLISLTGNAASNTFFLMPPETQAKLVPAATAKDIVGVCLLDLAQGKVVFSANVPKSLWTLSIYSQSGQQIYSINDSEAGTTSFAIELKRAKTFLQQVTGKAEPDDAGQIQNVGWHADVNDRQGIVVLWVPVDDAARRGALEAALKSTKCEAKG